MSNEIQVPLRTAGTSQVIIKIEGIKTIVVDEKTVVVKAADQFIEKVNFIELHKEEKEREAANSFKC